MKKVQVLSVLIVLFLFSCKKQDSTGEPTPEQYDIQFNVSGFSQEISDISSTKPMASTSSAGDYVSYIYYYIYNEKGNLVKSGKHEDKYSKDFSYPQEKLTNGQYTIVLVASTARLTSFEWDTLWSLSFGPYDKSQPFGDTFARSLTFEVNGRSGQFDVRLERVTAKLELTINDKLPADLTSFTLSYPSNAYFSALGNFGAVRSYLFSHTITQEDRNSWYRWQTFVMPETGSSSVAGDVIIKGYNSNQQLIVTKTIKGVTFTKNKKTTLTGNLNSDAYMTFYSGVDTSYTGTIKYGF
ncbi:hypothetical protein [Arcticibacter sp. MXS-1]|uniref:hypothetical protein n=1 Tax=Arcticibacter sp. MXS-1 TaxID=3341726 RepID=UPI0035A8C5D9